MYIVLHLTDFLFKKCFIGRGVLLSGSGADGQRAGQRDGQTGHPGRDREPAKANAEVCRHTHKHEKLATVIFIYP